LDFLLVAIDWLEVFDPDGDSLTRLRGLRVLRIVRMVRMVKAPELFRHLTEQIRSEELILVGTIGKIMASMLIVVHFLACAWYGVGASERFHDSWIRAPGSYVIDEDLALRYTMSFHWSLSAFSGETLITGTNLPERLYTVAVLFFAFMFSASLVSSITTAMTRLEILKRQNNSQLMQLRRYLADSAISGKLSVRVQRNAQHVLLEQKRNMPESSVELLKHISEPLLVELHFEVRSTLLVNHPFFECFDEINPAGIRKVCHTAVKQVTVSLGDVLFSDGEAPTHPAMYFLSGGTMRYKQEAGQLPLDVVSDIPQKVDSSASYVGNKYNALPWKDFIDIKLDARNLIEADVKSALTDLDWFGKINALYAGKQTEAELDLASKTIGAMKPVKYPIMK